MTSACGAARACILIMVQLAVASGAVADDRAASVHPDEAALDADARELFEAGSIQFKAERYEAAFESFSHAYEMSSRPPLLYNVGLAAERAGMIDPALSAYRAYLEWDLEGEKHTEVGKRIKTLEALKRKGVASPSEAAATLNADDSARPVDSKRLRKQWWVWTAAGAVVVAVIVGAAVASGGGGGGGSDNELPETTLGEISTFRIPL